MIELNVTQGSPEWLAARAKCFTASEASAMMGESRYQSRAELLRQKATGIVQEVDSATQARFEAGHIAEGLARSIAEEIIGESLFPLVATDDSGKYLASSDGATMLCDEGWEHKLLNASLVESVKAGIVPNSHKWQLVHQCMVFGFKRIMFSVSDGSKENHHYCWFSPTAEDFGRLMAGWEQFEIDLANYQPSESKPAAVAEVIEDLPALTVQLVGQVTASNLDAFQAAVTERIQAINTNLVTDSDFATADKMVKFLDDGEKRLELVKSQALAQTASIDQLFRTIDSLKAEMKSKRLTLDKLVKAEKENRKGEIVTKARAELVEHVQALHKRTGVICIQIDGGIFADAIKGLKTLDSMRDKLATALANAKIEANTIADRIERNRKAMGDHGHLFPDFAQVCTKADDDFAALVAARVAAEQQRKQQEAERAAQAEAATAAAKAAEQAKTLVPDVLQKIGEANSAGVLSDETTKELRECVASIAADIAIDAAKAGPTMKLGEICAALGFTVTADFLASLGIQPSGTERAAKLYPAAKFPTICRLIQEHIAKVQQQSLRRAA